MLPESEHGTESEIEDDAQKEKEIYKNSKFRFLVGGALSRRFAGGRPGVPVPRSGTVWVVRISRAVVMTGTPWRVHHVACSMEGGT